MKSPALIAIAAAKIFTVSPCASAFAPPTSNRAASGTNKCKYPPSFPRSTPLHNGPSADSIVDEYDATAAADPPLKKFRMAQSLLLSLINDEQCFTTFEGAQKFADSCAVNIVYEDCYEPQPIVGRSAVANHLRARISQRTGKLDDSAVGGRDARFRIDKISDGAIAAGFAWTWTTDSHEGLRGTTFVELDESNQIRYVREIAEPLFKPGDLILDVLKTVTADAIPRPPPDYVRRTPRVAHEIAKYLFNDVQGCSSEEAMRFFDESIVYRDFNYEKVMTGKAAVQKFIEDFSFPGITFATQRFDDGERSTCFTWEVLLDGAPEGSSIKGISFYEIDPETGLITYVRDVPESGIKPPPLGKLARQVRPALGVFRPVAIGSREGGL
ncbi:hypothetical protein ACHAW6_008118 [Cyclotella cf. meneghiniana]